MAGEDVRLKTAVKTVEDELNLLKNQVQQTLLDIREHILDVTNPFNNAQDLLADETKEDHTAMGAGGGSGEAAVEGAESEVGGAAEESAGEQEEILSEEPSVEDELAALPQDDVLAMDDQPVADDLMTDAVTAGAPPEEAFVAEDAPAEEEPEQGDEEAEEGPAEEETEEEAEEDGRGEDAEAEAETATVPPAPDLNPHAQLDLVTLAALVRWVSVTTQTLGRNRVEVLLDTYELAGRITPQVKNVIKTLCSLADEDPDGDVPVRDVLSAMVRMEGLVGGTKDNPSAHRLMAILLDDDDEPLTRLGMRG